MLRLFLAAALIIVSQGFGQTALAQSEAEQQQQPVQIVEPKLTLKSPNLVIQDVNEADTADRQDVNNAAGRLSTTLSARTGTTTFDFGSHRKANKNLVASKYMRELHKAMVWQDTFRQISSKAHFDNCAFDEGVGYIDALIKSVDRTMAQAQRHSTAGDRRKLEGTLKGAFFTLGQALHGIQDFYAHSNYIELMQEAHASFDAVPIIPLWEERGRQTLSELQKARLHSGTWPGFPQKCPPGTGSHDEVAKDSVTKGRGKDTVSQWGGITQHNAALGLATKASQNFIRFAYERWPLLYKETSGKAAYQIMSWR